MPDPEIAAFMSTLRNLCAPPHPCRCTDPACEIGNLFVRLETGADLEWDDFLTVMRDAQPGAPIVDLDELRAKIAAMSPAEVDAMVAEVDDIVRDLDGICADIGEW